MNIVYNGVELSPSSTTLNAATLNANYYTCATMFSVSWIDTTGYITSNTDIENERLKLEIIELKELAKVLTEKIIQLEGNNESNCDTRQS